MEAGCTEVSNFYSGRVEDGKGHYSPNQMTTKALRLYLVMETFGKIFKIYNNLACSWKNRKLNKVVSKIDRCRHGDVIYDRESNTNQQAKCID